MGFVIDPPRKVEGVFVAIFVQTDLADELALTLLRDRGFDAKPFPVMGDLALGVAGGVFGGGSLFGSETLVCVPATQARAATDVLRDESGLVEDDA